MPLRSYPRPERRRNRADLNRLGYTLDRNDSHLPTPDYIRHVVEPGNQYNFPTGDLVTAQSHHHAQSTKSPPLVRANAAG